MGQDYYQKNKLLVCAYLGNNKHIQWVEMKGEVLENSLNKLSMLVNFLEKYVLRLMAVSRVVMMVVSLVSSPQLARCSHSLFCCSHDTLSFVFAVVRQSLVSTHCL